MIPKSLLLFIASIASVPSLMAGVVVAPQITLDLPALPAGKTLTIEYDTTVGSLNGNTADLSTQATVTADGGINVQSSDPDVGPAVGPTLTDVLVNAAPSLAGGSALPVGVGGAGQTSYTFRIDYADDVAIDASSIDVNDVTVTGPGGPLPVTGAVASGPDSTAVSGTYTVTPPGGSWDPGDNGQYVIGIVANQVGDTGTPALFFPATSTITSFEVNIPDPAYTIVAIDAAKPEGDAGTTDYTFAVNRGGDTSVAGSVAYAISGPGAADINSSLIGTIPFPSNTTSVTLTVKVNGDSDIEADESFTVTLISPLPGGTLIGTPSTADGTIQNDDTGLAIAAAEANKVEGSSGTSAYTFNVTRTGFLNTAATVDWAVTGSGGSPADAADFGGTLPSGTASFSSGDSTKTVTVNVTGDTDAESDESFAVIISNASSGTITTATDTGTILNDDSLTVSIAANDADANENTADSGNFRISRNGTNGALAVDIELTPASTATPGADFALGGVMLSNGSGTITIPDGQRFVDVGLDPINDPAAEASENAILKVIATPGYAVGSSEDTVTIAANDTVVTNTSDFDPSTNANGGEGTLRQAMLNANTFPGPQNITFSDASGTAFTTAPQTITLTAGELSLTAGANIEGPLQPGRVTVDANNLSRVFDIRSTGGPTVLSRLTITGGSNPNGSGGGLNIDGTQLTTLRGCIIENNTAGRGGGFYNQSRATVINSTIRNNSSTPPFSGGGGIHAFGDLTLRGCTVNNNQSSGGGGGILCDSAFLVAVNSTISSNRAAFSGGGITTGNPMNLNNVTITGNVANFGGGGFPGTTGGGIRNGITAATLNNSIVAGNTTEGSGPSDIAGGIFGKFNLIGVNTGIDTSNFGNPDPSNLIGTIGSPLDPMLGPLADNGGPTLTHATLPSSPAIDGGDPTFDPSIFQPPLAFDQRGTGFDRVVSTKVDIGAFEIQVDLTPPVITCPADVLVECGDPTDPTATGMATATDNADANPVVTFSDETTPNGGGNYTITRTWTATDASGNTASCEQIITVRDTTAPAITCPPDLTIECGSPSDPGSTGMATATDICDPNPVITFTDSSNPGPNGSTIITRTWTATDENGNSSNCVQTITLVDTTPPVIVCPSDIEVDSETNAGVSVNFVVIASDVCDPNPVLVVTPTSGSVFPIGVTTVNATATDAAGNQSTCSFNVRVRSPEEVETLAYAIYLLDRLELPVGMESSLLAKFLNAISAIRAGRDQIAGPLLQSFKVDVALRRGTTLDEEFADDLTQAADGLLLSLGGGGNLALDADSDIGAFFTPPADGSTSEALRIDPYPLGDAGLGNQSLFGLRWRIPATLEASPDLSPGSWNRVRGAVSPYWHPNVETEFFFRIGPR